MATHRRLDDPSHGGATLLTLPLTDFPGASAPAAALPNDDTDGHSGHVADTDGLILVRLPPAGGLSVADLTSGRAYILGDTSQADVHDSLADATPVHEPSGGGGGSIEPVAARLLVEGVGKEGKTLELTRVETSNTYVVVPPLPLIEEGSNKRQKLDDAGTNGEGKASTATMPARSVGLVPGEESPSCFFLDPRCLPPGHFANALRGCLSRWTYDPFAPPPESSDKAPHKDGGGRFGYTVVELAHVCRTSRSEMECAVGSRGFGAEEALALPSSDKAVPVRYGTLSEEGRQTVGAAIVTTLLETDLELAWEGGPVGEGTEVGPLVDEVRAHWHRLEGEERAPPPEAPHLTDSTQQQEESQTESQSQFGAPSQLPAAPSAPLPLADEVVWHCLRPLVTSKGASTKDDMPERVRLVPDRVAELAAHHVFLRSTPATTDAGSRRGGAVWEESELLEAWATRLPSVPGGYEPRTELLRGIAVTETEVSEGVDGEEANLRLWRYLPEAGLPLLPAPRIQAMLAVRDAWTFEEAAPYLRKFVVAGEAEEGKEGQSQMAALLGRHARAIDVAVDKGDEGREGAATVYVAKQK